jgi:hypothetical protein
MRLRSATLVAVTVVATALTPQVSSAKRTTTPPPPPPAPAGFAASLTSMYTNMYRAATMLDSKTGRSFAKQLVSRSDFADRIHSLSRAQLAALYAATRKTANWNEMGSNTMRLLQDAQLRRSVRYRGSPRRRPTSRHASQAPKRTGSKRRAAARGPSLARSAQVGATAFPPSEPTGSFPAPLPPFEPSDEVIAFGPMPCISGPSPFAYFVAADTAVFVADIVHATAEAAGIPLESLIVAAGEGVINVVKIVDAAITLAAATVLDAFVYADDLETDCIEANEYDQTVNSENATVNTYNLHQQNAQTLAVTESSVNTLHDQVHVVQQSLGAQLTVEIQQALSLPTAAPADVYYELPASVGGNLDSTPIGVKVVVTAAYNAAKLAGLPINATATNNLAAANSALAARNYKTAWKDYQLAYQALG